MDGAYSPMGILLAERTTAGNKTVWTVLMRTQKNSRKSDDCETIAG
jgi:hypothetical protein